MPAGKRGNSWEFIIIPLPSYKEVMKPNYKFQEKKGKKKRKLLEKSVSLEIDEILGSSITSLYSGS